MSGFLTALAAVFNALFLIAAIYIYVSLIRQIGARSGEAPAEGQRTFGLPEAVLGAALGTLFALNAAAATSQAGKLVLRTQDLIANAVISIGLLLFVAAFLKIRGLSVVSLAGFSKVGFWRTLVTGGILLFAAYPLVFLADLATRRFLGGDSSRQGIVELFNDSQTLQQRVMIIILAIAIAPLVEEFVFRFFLYGVVRRYLGRSVGLAANSMLFAAVHAHVPSAAPLFVLGACFTVAYEWSGSILVPMAMHALFNSLTLTALAFPELLQQ
ncbi:MAG TPA: CPBP family intramembrane glutamic endopeptidase [Chthoniobacterales bacterium]|nr:CPBP family intramembrane glutamic endopeptidase [Chthoniobacterales bacterium]